MSIQLRARAGRRTVWQVTWRDPDGRQRAESYPTRRLAEARDSQLRDLRWQGKLDEADAGAEPLYDAADAWWTDHVEPNLARSTILSYVHVLDHHLLPRLGETPIRDISPARVVALQRDHTRGADVADRRLAEARQQMVVEHVDVAEDRRACEVRFDVVSPPCVGRIVERLGAGVSLVELALPAQVT